MKAFKIKNGLSATRYLGSNGTGTIGIVGYDISGASYDSVSFSVHPQDTNPVAIFFKPDGTKMYVLGLGGDDVNEYNLSTAWDITTSVYSQSFSVSSQETYPLALFFNPNGTRMYVVGNLGKDINAYRLTTAWDVSTAVYLENFYVGNRESNPTGLFFKPDGTKMYITGNGGDEVNEFNLSTAWDITTSVYSQLFSVSSQESYATSIFFKSDGLSMYITGTNGREVNEFSLSTAWDISTASFSQLLDVSAQDNEPQAIFLKPDGTKMFIVGEVNNSVFQYSTVSYTQTLDLSTGTTFSLTPSGATTVSFTNPPASGNAIGFSVEVVNTGGRTITWPDSVKWHEATAPTVTASKELYAFVTTDGGTTYYGRKAAEEIA
jgi:hypothetical protein